MYRAGKNCVKNLQILLTIVGYNVILQFRCENNGSNKEIEKNKKVVDKGNDT